MRHLSDDRLEEIVQRAQLAIHSHDHDRFYNELLDIIGDMVDLMIELRKVREEERRFSTRVVATARDEGATHLVLQFLEGQGLQEEFERWLCADREEAEARAS